MKKILLVALCLSLGAPVLTHAQDKIKIKKHWVKMKPAAPTYTRVVSPGDNYYYIKEDWTWNPTTSTWDWYGNRWVETPATTRTYVPGHWMQTSDGWNWVDGYWK